MNKKKSLIFLPKLGRLVRFIKGYPHSSNAKTWETDKTCTDLRNKLLPHYFSPTGYKLDPEKIIIDLLSGIHNEGEWYRDMGLEISTKTPFWAMFSQNKILDQTFAIHPPSRYEDVFMAATETHDFWGFLGTCTSEVKVTVLYSLDRL